MEDETEMSFEFFLLMLLVVSVFTGLFTEGIKKTLAEYGKPYHANVLAGVVAVALSAVIGTGYMILTETRMNEKMAVILLALLLLSWLSAMVGYDKVIQAISQLKNA